MKELESDNDDLKIDDMDKDLLELENEGLDDISHDEISGMDIKVVITDFIFILKIF